MTRTSSVLAEDHGIPYGLSANRKEFDYFRIARDPFGTRLKDDLNAAAVTSYNQASSLGLSLI